MALRATFIVQEIGIHEIAFLCEALTRINELHLERNPATVPLYSAGIRYVPEDGREEFADLPTVYARRQGDCEDLAAVRCSELRLTGYPQALCLPVEVFPASRGRPRLIHILVIRDPADPLRQWEDPSSRLGMPPVPDSLIRTLIERHARWLLPRCSSWRS